MLNRKLAVALAAALIHAPLALGQTTTWRVAAGEDGRIVTPGLPAGTGVTLADAILGDSGAGQIGIRVVSPEALSGYWASRQGTFTRYTQLGVTGDTGPGRSGAEAAHVFLNVYTGDGAAAPSGQRTFVGRAGEGPVATASYGIWRWDGVRNTEIARTLVDTALGPGLGASWIFPDASDFAAARAYGSSGYVLLDATVKNISNISSHALIKHVPGQGNVPCMRNGATETALAPGLSAGDSFQNTWSMLNNISVSRSGQVYGRLSASGSRGGIWELCNGAPRVLAVNAQTGAKGPSLGISTATFTTDMEAPQPGLPGQLYFFSFFRRIDGGSMEYGLFWHDGSSNRAIAYRDTSGFYGPNWMNSTWRTFNQDSLSTGGEYAAFSASVDTTDGGTPQGFWRVRAGRRPELVALIGVSGEYEPEPNHTWSSFGASTVLANGDILLEARTSPGDLNGLWLLEPGRSPRKLLETGQTVTVPTTTGAQATTITYFDLPNGGSDYSRGRDRWAGADGSVLVSATVATYGTVLLTTQASDRIFRDGLD